MREENGDVDVGDHNQRQVRMLNSTTSVVPVDSHSQGTQEAESRLHELLDRAKSGDRDAAKEVRQLLRETPTLRLVSINPVQFARRMMLEALFDQNLVARDEWERHVDHLEGELAGTNPSPLERTLCERIATCWLDVHLAEITLTRAQRSGVSASELTYYQGHQDRAHTRYLAAVQALARVQRLLRPIMTQINIASPGAQQLNIAASHTEPAPTNTCKLEGASTEVHKPSVRA